MLKTCSIIYNNSKPCSSLLISHHIHFRRQYSESLSNVVVVGLPFVPHLDLNGGREYCFVASANNGTHTALIQGSYTQGILILYTCRYCSCLSLMFCTD